VTVDEVAKTIVDLDPEDTQLPVFYWNLPLWEADLVDRIRDELPPLIDDLDPSTAMRIWARLKVDGVLVSHIYREDEVLF
jgi:hypothetical protein